MITQFCFTEFSKQERYDSLKEISTSGGGVIMLRDLKPGVEQNIVEVSPNREFLSSFFIYSIVININH